MININLLPYRRRRIDAIFHGRYINYRDEKPSGTLNAVLDMHEIARARAGAPRNAILSRIDRRPIIGAPFFHSSQNRPACVRRAAREFGRTREFAPNAFPFNGLARYPATNANTLSAMSCCASRRLLNHNRRLDAIASGLHANALRL